MKIISKKKYYQDMKSFVEQISLKYEGFINQDEFGTNRTIKKHIK